MLADDAARIALEALLAEAGLADASNSVAILGRDPVVPSRHRLGAAAASALGALGTSVSVIWRERTGRRQTVSVDMRRATVVGLRTNLCLRLNGYGIDHLPPGEGGPANFFHTRDDRWIFIHRSSVFPETLSRLLDVLDCPLSSPRMAEAVEAWDAQSLEDVLAEQRLIGAIARTRSEWSEHPQGRWLAAQPVVSIERIGDAPPQALTRDPERPLSGLRVLDLTHVLAGPVATRCFAEHGADVLRISAPHRPDPLPMVIDTNFGKRAAFLDLDRQKDADRLQTLLSSTDVVVQAFRPGVAERRNFGAAAAERLRPGVVYVSISGYGHAGPWATRGGYEPLSQTACGLVIDEGSPQQPRFVVTRTLNDFLAAYLAAFGALAALVRRMREGGSYHVRVSLTGVSMWVQRLGLIDTVPGDDLPAPQAPDLMRTPSSFGMLEHAAPIVQLTETPGRYASPPTTLGAASPEWLSR